MTTFGASIFPTAYALKRLAAVVGIFAWTMPLIASAVPFQQLNCQQPIEISYVRDSREQARDVNRQSDYANALVDVSRIYMNPYVDDVFLDFDAFDTTYPDRLAVNGYELAGQPWLGNRWFHIGGAGASTGVEFTFLSNNDTQMGRGYHVRALKAFCTANSATQMPPTIHDYRRTDGILLGTGDTLYFRVDGSEYMQIISVRGQGLGTDFDLYARETSLPEQNAFDFSSVTPGTSDELIVIPGKTEGHTYFVAVNSSSGAGAFRIWRGEVKKTFVLNVGSNFTSQAFQRVAWGDSLRQAAKLLFGMSEGQVLVSSVVMHNNPAPAYPYECTCGGEVCDVCLDAYRTRSVCFSSVIDLSYSDFQDPRVQAHEMGHCLMGTSDHYGDHSSDTQVDVCHSDDQCGHSIMALHWTWINNICRSTEHGRNYIANHVCAKVDNPFPICGGRNELPDGGSPDGSCPVGFSIKANGWSEASSELPSLTVPLTTPDNYDFQDFDPLDSVIAVIDEG